MFTIFNLNPFIGGTVSNVLSYGVDFVTGIFGK